MNKINKVVKEKFIELKHSHDEYVKKILECQNIEGIESGYLVSLVNLQTNSHKQAQLIDEMIRVYEFIEQDKNKNTKGE